MGGAISPIQKCRSSRPSAAIAPVKWYLHHGPLLPPLNKHERSERLAATPAQLSAVQKAAQSSDAAAHTLNSPRFQFMPSAAASSLLRSGDA